MVESPCWRRLFWYLLELIFSFQFLFFLSLTQKVVVSQKHWPLTAGEMHYLWWKVLSTKSCGANLLERRFQKGQSIKAVDEVSFWRHITVMEAALNSLRWQEWHGNEDPLCGSVFRETELEQAWNSKKPFLRLVPYLHRSDHLVKLLYHKLSCLASFILGSGSQSIRTDLFNASNELKSVRN